MWRLEAPDVVLGTFPVNSVPATVLFDSGASHSFVTRPFVSKADLKPSALAKPMIVQIPGATTRTELACQKVPIEIHGSRFYADLIILGKQGLEVILGMNWLAKYQGHIDCANRAVTVTSSEGKVILHVSSYPSSKVRCKAGTAEPTLDQLPIVCGNADVFPDELPGMTPDRDIEF